MVSCLKCKRSAITFVRYSGAHLCKHHFIDFFERRVKKELRKQCSFQKKEKIAVAVSGGKDSTVMLFILKKFLSARKGLELEAITVDEGIKGYRDESISVLKHNCSEWGIPHHVVSFKEQFKYALDEIAPAIKNRTCAFCGVFRRYCLNKLARELNATLVATGHNLDDTTQSILMNLARGDLEKLARMGPHRVVQRGLVPRIEPLRAIPEKETYLYALVNRINFYPGECHYSEQALRNLYRDILYKLEENSPGTRHAVLRSYDSISELLRKKFPPANLKLCELCKEPTTQRICKACELKRELDESVK